MRAACQALVSLMVVTGVFPFLYIFGSAWKAGKRVSAISGWAITLLAILCSVVPAAEVKNVALFETKPAVGTAAVVATAWLLYRRAPVAPAVPAAPLPANGELKRRPCRAIAITALMRIGVSSE